MKYLLILLFLAVSAQAQTLPADIEDTPIMENFEHLSQELRKISRNTTFAQINFTDGTTQTTAASIISTFTYHYTQVSSTADITGTCIANTTITMILTQACTVEYIFSGSLVNSHTSAGVQVTFLVDENIPAPFTSSSGMLAGIDASGSDSYHISSGFTVRGTAQLSAGSHDFCFSLARFFTSNGTAILNSGGLGVSYFEVRTRPNCDD